MLIKDIMLPKMLQYIISVVKCPIPMVPHAYKKKKTQEQYFILYKSIYGKQKKNISTHKHKKRPLDLMYPISLCLRVSVYLITNI